MMVDATLTHNQVNGVSVILHQCHVHLFSDYITLCPRYDHRREVQYIQLYGTKTHTTDCSTDLGENGSYFMKQMFSGPRIITHQVSVIS